jgi:hypothetical protein
MDMETGETRVSRLLGAFPDGRIVNTHHLSLAAPRKHDDGVPLVNPVRAYAACEYSLISPLRIVRRRTRAAARSVIGGVAVSAAGGNCCQAWCGGCSLLRHESRTL